MSKSIEELRTSRQIAQESFQKEMVAMRKMQTLYDDMKNRYEKAHREYQQADLAYAMKTKLMICKPKKSNKHCKRPYKKSSYSSIPKAIRKQLEALPPEKLLSIIEKFESKP